MPPQVSYTHCYFVWNNLYLTISIHSDGYFVCPSMLNQYCDSCFLPNWLHSFLINCGKGSRGWLKWPNLSMSWHLYMINIYNLQHWLFPCNERDYRQERITLFTYINHMKSKILPELLGDLFRANKSHTKPGPSIKIICSNMIIY